MQILEEDTKQFKLDSFTLTIYICSYNTYTHTHRHTQTHSHTYTLTHSLTCTHARTHAHAHTHTHTHTNILNKKNLRIHSLTGL